MHVCACVCVPRRLLARIRACENVKRTERVKREGGVRDSWGRCPRTGLELTASGAVCFIRGSTLIIKRVWGGITASPLLGCSRLYTTASRASNSGMERKKKKAHAFSCFLLFVAFEPGCIPQAIAAFCSLRSIYLSRAKIAALALPSWTYNGHCGFYVYSEDTNHS